MQSYEKRFNGNRQEVLDYTRTWGIWKAMSKFDVKDYGAFRKWLRGQTDDENFGLHPVSTGLGGSGGNNILQTFVQEFADYVDRARDKERAMDEEIKHLRTQLEYYKARDMGIIEAQLMPVMEAIKD